MLSMARYVSRFRRDERGQALVEFSLVVVLFMALVLGVVEVGRVGHAYLAVVHASREGARLGALGKSDTEVFAAVRDAAVALDPARIGVTIHPPPTSRMRGTPLTVMVEYEVDLFAPVIREIFPNPFPVRGQTVMRTE